jgi:hypothetical protein
MVELPAGPCWPPPSPHPTGDSGGPAYLGPPDQAQRNRQLLGIVIGGDELCKVGGYILRLDTPESREFLRSNGAPVPG